MALTLQKRPPFGSTFVKGEDAEIIKDMNKAIAAGIDFYAEEHSRVEENSAYERGEQWRKGDADRQLERERPAFALNSLVKIINSIANREIMDRIVPSVHGRTPDDNGVAESFNEACRWQRDMSETEHEESMAFRQCVASGYGVMHKYWSESALDGFGMIADEELPLWYMLVDPTARKQNLTDRRWHACGKYVPVKDLDEWYGSTSTKNSAFLKKIASGSALSQSGSNSTHSGNLMSWGWGDISAGRWFRQKEQEIFIVEYEWLEKKNVYKVAYPEQLDQIMEMVSDPQGEIPYGVDPETQEPITMPVSEWQQMEVEEKNAFMINLLADTKLMVIEEKKEFDAINAMYQSLTGEDIEFVRKPREYTKYAIRVADRILEKGIRPMGFTYEFMTGLPFEKRDGKRFYGMIDVTKGPQDMKNVFFSNALALWMTSPKQNLLIEEGALENPDKFVNDYAKLSGIHIVPDGFVAGQRFMQMQPNTFPPMLQEMIQIASNAVEEQFGLSSVETGSQSDMRRVSGTAVTAARQASNTILAIFFDSLRRYRKRYGMMNVKFIQSVYDVKQIARIIGDEAAAGLKGASEWPEINRVDIKIDESPTSVSEQMETVDFLTRTGTLDKWIANGTITSEDAIDLMVNLPQSTREKIKANAAGQSQLKQQLQSMQSEVEKMTKEKEMWKNFLLTIDRGGEISAAWNAMSSLAEQMIAQSEQAAQQGQEEQPQ